MIFSSTIQTTKGTYKLSLPFRDIASIPVTIVATKKADRTEFSGVNGLSKTKGTSMTIKARRKKISDPSMLFSS